MNFINDLLWDVLVSSTGVAIAVLVSAVAYWIGVRRQETSWIRNNGLMLLIYFRNVDWRCQKLCHMIAKGTWKQSRPDRNEIHIELIKLQSDLNALDRTAEMWARRFENIKIWYPHAKDISDMLDAQSNLHTSLLRHVEPLVFYLQEFSDEPSEQNKKNSEQIQLYLEYFSGNYDRLWRTKDDSSAISPELGKLKNKNLQIRLADMHSPMIRLLKKFKTSGIPNMKLWNKEVDSDAIWFDPDSAGSHLPPISSVQSSTHP